MSGPFRIQLSRGKGWRMPPETVKVDRSTRYGNPWPIGEWGPLDRKAPDALGATGLFGSMLHDPEMRAAAGYPEDLSSLRGRNLACWCKLCPAHVNGKPLGLHCVACSPCHVDPLGRFVNSPATTTTGD